MASQYEKTRVQAARLTVKSFIILKLEVRHGQHAITFFSETRLNEEGRCL